MEVDSTENDDSLNVASKCWNRLVDIAIKTGYREGIQDGADSVLQEGFEIGYKDGFKTAFLLGKYKSLLNNIALSPRAKHPIDVTSTLDKTNRGVCWICDTESRTSVYQSTTGSVYENISFSKALNNQRVYSTKIINRLHEYFQPILEGTDRIDLSLQ